MKGVGGCQFTTQPPPSEAYKAETRRELPLSRWETATLLTVNAADLSPLAMTGHCELLICVLHARRNWRKLIIDKKKESNRCFRPFSQLRFVGKAMAAWFQWGFSGSKTRAKKLYSLSVLLQFGNGPLSPHMPFISRERQISQHGFVVFWYFNS